MSGGNNRVQLLFRILTMILRVIVFFPLSIRCIFQSINYRASFCVFNFEINRASF
uniref:Uncharacterized protein n=1 Tax=Oryza brachyantha TaxID=4533 RepID=J3MFX2_ORYBR